MKVVMTDSFNRDYVADFLVAENVNNRFLKEIVDHLNNLHGGKNSQNFFIAVEDDYRLSRGMYDLV